MTPTTVELDHWTHPRLPADHPLHERWDLVLAGKTLLTRGTEADAREAAAEHGWSIARGEGARW